MKVGAAWRECFAPRDIRPIWEWAREKVQLFPPLTRTGPFDVTDTRHFLGPLEALQSDYVREVNVLAPVRDGKTLIADVWLPWVIVNDPGPFLGIFQKDDIAKEHCELRTWPMLEAIPEVMAKMPMDRHKKRTQDILFSDHNPVFIWGPAIKNLQSKGFRYLWMDESWLYSKGVIGEAKGRLGDFVKQGIEKVLCTSQGGYVEDLGAEENKDWWDQFSSGECNPWHVCCRRCQGLYDPKWIASKPDGAATGMVFDEHKDDRGLWIPSRVIPTARYVCPLCGHAEPISECRRVQAAWNATGEYRVVGEPKGVKKSFQWNGLITYPWDYLLDLFLTARNAAAQGDNTLTIQFWQKRMAEFYDPGKDYDLARLKTVEIIARKDETKELIVEGISFRHFLMSADVQMHSFWTLLEGYSDAGDSITLWSGEVYSWDDLRSVQIDKAKELGIVVPDSNVAVDVSHRWHEVIQACARYGHFAKHQGKDYWLCWKALRGADQRHFIYTPKSGRQKGQRLPLPYTWPPDKGDPCAGMSNTDPRRAGYRGKYVQLITWSNPTIKDVAIARRDDKAAAVRSLVGRGDWNEEFARQMHSQKKEQHNGRWRWVKFRADHLFDCKCMNLVQAFMKHLLGPRLEEEC